MILESRTDFLDDYTFDDYVSDHLTAWVLVVTCRSYHVLHLKDNTQTIKCQLSTQALEVSVAKNMVPNNNVIKYPNTALHPTTVLSTIQLLHY